MTVNHQPQASGRIATALRSWAGARRLWAPGPTSDSSKKTDRIQTHYSPSIGQLPSRPGWGA